MAFERINILPIVAAHFDTLRDYGTDRRSYSDLLLFLVTPVAFGGLSLWYDARLRAAAVTGLLTASAIFVALLMNLLIMVLTFLRATRGNPGDKSLQLRKRYLREIVANLSFSILMALVLVGTALGALFSLKEDQDLIGRWPTCLLTIGAVALVLSLLMVLRRMYVLILSEFDRHKLDQIP